MPAVLQGSRVRACVRACVRVIFWDRNHGWMDKVQKNARMHTQKKLRVAILFGGRVEEKITIEYYYLWMGDWKLLPRQTCSSLLTKGMSWVLVYNP